MIAFGLGVVLGIAAATTQDATALIGMVGMMLVAMYVFGRKHVKAEAVAVAVAEAKAEARAAALANASVVLHQTFAKGDPAGAEPGRVLSPGSADVGDSHELLQRLRLSLVPGLDVVPLVGANRDEEESAALAFRAIVRDEGETVTDSRERNRDDA